MAASRARDARSWSVAQRDRMAITTALVGVSLLAWAYLFLSARGMGSAGSMDMDVVGMSAWGPSEFVLTFLMWAIMMVGMMVPSAIPMTLVYGAVVRKAAGQGAVVAPTGAFVSGYVLVWTLFSAGATLAQWGLDRAAVLSPMLVLMSPAIGAGVLIGAGLYQVSPVKEACLSHCRSPAHFISRHWRPGTLGALRMGWVHGLFCLGCCWMLMALLFVGGVMNLLWVAAIALFVLIEKLVPHPTLPARIGGVAMILIGVAMLVAWRG